MKWINAEAKIRMQIYDEEHEEYITREMTVEDALDAYTEDGCPTTVDAEPIIRCKDCYFCGEIDENGWHWCQNTGTGMPKDGFCSEAERKGWNWGR